MIGYLEKINYLIALNSHKFYSYIDLKKTGSVEHLNQIDIDYVNT